LPQCFSNATDIARREGATLFIPVSSPIASLYDAMAAEALPEGCRWGLQLMWEGAQGRCKKARAVTVAV